MREVKISRNIDFNFKCSCNTNKLVGEEARLTTLTPVLAGAYFIDRKQMKGEVDLGRI